MLTGVWHCRCVCWPSALTCGCGANQGTGPHLRGPAQPCHLPRDGSRAGLQRNCCCAPHPSLQPCLHHPAPLGAPLGAPWVHPAGSTTAPGAPRLSPQHRGTAVPPAAAPLSPNGRGHPVTPHLPGAAACTQAASTPPSSVKLLPSQGSGSFRVDRSAAASWAPQPRFLQLDQN